MQGWPPGVVQDPEHAESVRGGCASLGSVQMGGQSVTVNVSVPCMNVLLSVYVLHKSRASFNLILLLISARFF